MEKKSTKFKMAGAIGFKIGYVVRGKRSESMNLKSLCFVSGWNRCVDPVKVLDYSEAFSRIWFLWLSLWLFTWLIYFSKTFCATLRTKYCRISPSSILHSLRRTKQKTHFNKDGGILTLGIRLKAWKRSRGNLLYSRRGRYLLLVHVVHSSRW